MSFFRASSGAMSWSCRAIKSRMPLVAVGCIFAMFSTPPLFASIVFPNVIGPYRIAYVTAERLTAASSNIDDYNAFVTLHAPTGDPRLVGLTWRAIASTPATDARTNTFTTSTDTDYPIYNTNGQLIANSNADLWDGTLANPISFTQTGGLPTSGTFVWTGSLPDGTGWSSAHYELGAGFVNNGAGQSTATGNTWIKYGGINTEGTLHLYGISSPLSNSGDVPEPSSLVIFGTSFSMFGLVWFLRRRRAAKS
jgi:hypothetical protein